MGAVLKILRPEPVLVDFGEGIGERRLRLLSHGDVLDLLGMTEDAKSLFLIGEGRKTAALGRELVNAVMERSFPDVDASFFRDLPAGNLPAILELIWEKNEVPKILADFTATAKRAMEAVSPKES